MRDCPISKLSPPFLVGYGYNIWKERKKGVFLLQPLLRFLERHREALTKHLMSFYTLNNLK